MPAVFLHRELHVKMRPVCRGIQLLCQRKAVFILPSAKQAERDILLPGRMDNSVRVFL